MMPAGVQAMIGHVGAASLVVIAMHGKLRSGASGEWRCVLCVRQERFHGRGPGRRAAHRRFYHEQ